MVVLKESELPTVHQLRPFEVRVERLHDNEVAVEVWQQPLQSRQGATNEAVKVARARGIALHAVWDHLLLLLKQAKRKPSLLSPARRDRSASLPEEVGVRMALLVGAVSPLRKLERIERVAAAIGAMSYEEACYWYALVRAEEGRRALRALRLLLAPD